LSFAAFLKPRKEATARSANRRISVNFQSFE